MNENENNIVVEITEEIYETLRGEGNRKFMQKLEELELNTDFNEELSVLKKKYKKEIREYKLYSDREYKIQQKIDKLTENGKNKPLAKKLTSESKSKYGKDLFSKQDSLWLNLEKKTKNECVRIAKKFNLFPLDHWAGLIASHLTSPIKSLRLSLVTIDPWITYSSRNCLVYTKKNRETKEEEIFIKIFPHTSIDDIKKSWKQVEEFQKNIVKRFKIKRPYSKSTLNTARKLKELDEDNLSTWEEQEVIFGDTSPFPIEKKRVNNLRKIRSRYGIKKKKN